MRMILLCSWNDRWIWFLLGNNWFIYRFILQLKAQTSTCCSPHHWSYLMIFPILMIKKTFPYSAKIHNYSSISNKLFDVMAVSLSYFPLLDIDLFFFLFSSFSWEVPAVSCIKLKLKEHAQLPLEKWQRSCRVPRSNFWWRKCYQFFFLPDERTF